MIPVLFVETNGCYFNDPRLDPWDIDRNALKYKGPHKSIAHPPCKRWGRYWSGGPMIKIRKLRGDDDNCFAHALWCVRTFGGVIEHPEASSAWVWFGLNKPPKKGGWVKADNYGGWTCCVEQGHYGHKARKATWLYLNKCDPQELIWGKAEGKIHFEDSFRSNMDRKYSENKGHTLKDRITKKDRLATPPKFKELLIQLVSEDEYL